MTDTNPTRPTDFSDRSGFKRLAFGSATEAVIRNAPAPILTVHRDVAHHEGLYRRIDRSAKEV